MYRVCSTLANLFQAGGCLCRHDLISRLEGLTFPLVYIRAVEGVLLFFSIFDEQAWCNEGGLVLGEKMGGRFDSLFDDATPAASIGSVGVVETFDQTGKGCTGIASPSARSKDDVLEPRAIVQSVGKEELAFEHFVFRVCLMNLAVQVWALPPWGVVEFVGKRGSVGVELFSS